jgi:hypothetical protein
MAVIYPKSTTAGTMNAVILDPKQALVYPFGFDDWTKIRVGILISYTTPSDDNASMDSYGSPSIVAVNDRDRLYYGIKRVSSNFPRENNEVFVGLKSSGATTYIDFPAAFLDHRNGHGAFTHVGVFHPNGSVDGKAYDPVLNQAYGIVSPSSANVSTSGYAGLITWYLEIINKGKANQQLLIRQNQQQITDAGRTNVHATMISANLTTLGTFPFNLAGVPYEVPNSFFIYNPIAGVRTRVFALSALKEE